MFCDICSKKGEFTILRPSAIRKAIRRGFNPFKLELVPGVDAAALYFVASTGRSIDRTKFLQVQYEEWVKKAKKDKSNWNICDSCKKHLDSYL